MADADVPAWAVVLALLPLGFALNAASACRDYMDRVPRFLPGRARVVHRSDMTHARTIAILRTSVTEAFATVDGWFDRPEGERAFRPASHGWTIDQVLEHISLANHFLMLTWRKAVEKAVHRAACGHVIPAGESDLQRLQAIGRRGSFSWTRPEHMEPRGHATPDEVRATLNQQRDECLALLDRLRNGEGALGQLHMSVDALGRIDLYQWLYFLVQHARRHVQQMAAIEREFMSGR